MLTTMLYILLFASCWLTMTHSRCKFLTCRQFCLFWSPLYLWHLKECLVHSSFSTIICWKSESESGWLHIDSAAAYFILAPFLSPQVHDRRMARCRDTEQSSRSQVQILLLPLSPCDLRRPLSSPNPSFHKCEVKMINVWLLWEWSYLKRLPKICA